MLVDWQIKKECEQGLVQHYNPDFIRPNSLDFRLGRYIKTEIAPDWMESAIALQKLWIEGGEKAPHPKYVELQELLKQGIFKTIDLSCTSESNPYPLESGEFILAATVEYLSIPDNRTVDIVLRSTSARKGLNHSLAGLCDSGYQGCPTLEISNVLRWHPVEIWYGMPIGQFLFHENASPDLLYHQSSGNYQGFTEPTEAK